MIGISVSPITEVLKNQINAITTKNAVLNA